MVVVKPGEKLNEELGINDFIAASLVLLFYPLMDDEILEIIANKKQLFGSAHIALISKENLPPGLQRIFAESNTIWFIKDEEETIFNDFDVVGNNCKAAFWVDKDGIIMAKVQQLTDMKFCLENLIPNSEMELDQENTREDERIETMIKDRERGRVSSNNKKREPFIIGALVFSLLVLLALSIGYHFLFH